MRHRSMVWLAAWLLVLPGGAMSATAGEPMARLVPDGPQTAIFPSDRFTKADPAQLTGRRIDLPLPADCTTHASECDDVRDLNELDGFSLAPRLSIAFDGEIDVASVDSRRLFVVRLADASVPSACPKARFRAAADIIGVRQVLWDPPSRTLHAQPERLLAEHSRYAVVLTDGVTAKSGAPIQGAPPSAKTPNVLGVNDAADARCLLELARVANSRRQGDVVAVSVFTTQSVTYLRRSVAEQVAKAPQPTADLRLGRDGARAVFSVGDIRAITHARQTTLGGPLSDVDIGLQGLISTPGPVGTLAFGRFRAPSFMAHPGEYIARFASRTGTARVLGEEELYFTLALPAGPMPRAGWPVVVYSYGGGDDRTHAVLAAATIHAAHGLAVLAIDNVGHGFGPRSRLRLDLASGTSVDLPASGRGLDQNGDGAIAPGNAIEGIAALAPHRLHRYADAAIQLGADLQSTVRLIHGGVDIEGDGRPDLDPARIYLLGQSIGSQWAIPFAAEAKGVTAAAFMAPPGVDIDLRLTRSENRSLLGAEMAARKPPMINSATGVTMLGGIPVKGPYFNEAMPNWAQPPTVNSTPGAMPIQEWIDRIRWIGEPSDPTVYARALAAEGPPVMLFFAKGDRSAPLFASAAIVREGGLSERAVLYRHDVFVAAHPGVERNPHGVWRMRGEMQPISDALQTLTAEFFATSGKIKTTSTYFETPMRGPFPTDFDFIP